MRLVRKCALILIKNKKLLLSREFGDKRFLTIGGKIEYGENDLRCLQRELVEETGTAAKDETLKFLNEFVYKSDEMELYIRAYTGELKDEPRTTRDIEELRWFNRKELEDAPVEIVTPITKFRILPFLIERDLI